MIIFLSTAGLVPFFSITYIVIYDFPINITPKGLGASVDLENFELTVISTYANPSKIFIYRYDNC